MNLFKNINENLHLDKLQGASHNQVKNAFLANYVAALVLLRLQDLSGLMSINDPQNAALTKFTPTMSDLNFWGRATLYPEDTEVRRRLQNGSVDALSKSSRGVTDARIQKMMSVMYSPPELLDWDDTVSALLLLKVRHHVSSSYLDKTCNILLHWDKLSDVERKKAITFAFMYLMQSDPSSKLLPRLRELCGSTMLNPTTQVAKRVIGFRVKENLNAIVSGGVAAPEPVDHEDQGELYNTELGKKHEGATGKRKVKITKDGRIIRRRVKAFKARRFKAPPSLKPTRDDLDDKELDKKAKEKGISRAK